MTTNQTTTISTEKLAQYHEFFSIEHAFTVNIEKLNANDIISDEAFEASIPIPFKLASDNVTIDQKALRPIQNLSSMASQLMEYLHHQANKIDLLIGYIISQHDEEDKRCQGLTFGGGGISITTNEQLNLGDKLAVKIFLLNQNIALFCHCEVIELIVKPEENQTSYKLIFDKIRLEDKEMLVRASLQIQAKQLQLLAQKRSEQKLEQ